MTNQRGFIPIIVIIVGVIVLSALGYFLVTGPTAEVSTGTPTPNRDTKDAVANTNTAGTTNQNTNPGNGTAAESEIYPVDVAQNYGVNTEPYSFYVTVQDNARQNIPTPFELKDYHSAVTPYGVLFWKKGETETTRLPSFGEQDIEYENGVQPDFRWYDFKRQGFVTPPSVSWKTGDRQFDRVFAVHPSSSQPRVVVEIGEYDVTSDEFEPGLIDSQPVKSRGLLFTPVTNRFESDDPLKTYLSVLGLPTTQWHGFAWDSQAQVAVAVPGGEGCGPYSQMHFVDLRARRKITVGSPGNVWGGYDYVAETCNPKNGRSPDSRWLILWGKTNEDQWAIRLFQPKTQAEVLKVVRIPYTTTDDYPEQWDVSSKYPKITMKKGSIIDFNK